MSLQSTSYTPDETESRTTIQSRIFIRIPTSTNRPISIWVNFHAILPWMWETTYCVYSWHCSALVKCLSSRVCRLLPVIWFTKHKLCIANLSMKCTRLLLTLLEINNANTCTTIQQAGLLRTSLTPDKYNFTCYKCWGFTWYGLDNNEIIMM